MRRDSSETKRKILTVCVRLFLEQGYKNTSVSQIVDEAGAVSYTHLDVYKRQYRIGSALFQCFLKSDCLQAGSVISGTVKGNDSGIRMPLF